jgi:hypothetical protein
MTANMAETRVKADQSRRILVTSANLRKRQLLQGARSRALRMAPGIGPVWFSSCLLLWNDDNFRSGDIRQELFASANVFVHKARWGVGEPLTQRNILVL